MHEIRSSVLQTTLNQFVLTRFDSLGIQSVGPILISSSELCLVCTLLLLSKSGVLLHFDDFRERICVIDCTKTFDISGNNSYVSCER